MNEYRIATKSGGEYVDADSALQAVEIWGLGRCSTEVTVTLNGVDAGTFRLITKQADMNRSRYNDLYYWEQVS